MTATNHALTGALIGLSIGNPLIAIPAALLSHFVLDALPHYGSPQEEPEKLKSIWFRNYLIVEAILCFGIVAVLVIVRPQYWALAAVCAFIASSPDLVSANRYFKVRSGKSWKPSAYSRFASYIQWFERPIGALVEAAWLFAMVFLLVNLLVI